MMPAAGGPPQGEGCHRSYPEGAGCPPSAGPGLLQLHRGRAVRANSAAG